MKIPRQICLEEHFIYKYVYIHTNSQQMESLWPPPPEEQWGFRKGGPGPAEVPTGTSPFASVFFCIL